MDAKRRNAVKKSSLTEIKGIGAKKANELMLHFGTLAALKNATREELLQVKGITESVADAVIEYFGKEEQTQ
jgi:excinuclease ABC subunit C